MFPSDLVDRRRKVELETVVNEGIQSLEQVQHHILSMYEIVNNILTRYDNVYDIFVNANTGKNMLKLVKDLEILIATCNSDLYDKLELLKSFNHEYNDSLKISNDQYCAINNQLIAENKTLKKQLTQDNKDTTDKLNQVYDLIRVQNNHVNLLFDLVEDSIKNIALSKYIRSAEYKQRDMSNQNNPNYRQDIDNKAIKIDRDNGLNINQLAKKYGMSYPGMKHRLELIDAEDQNKSGGC